MRALVLLAATVGATALAGVPAAEAASWTNQSGAAYQTCTTGRTHNKVTYTTCIQHNAGFAKVRVVVKVATSARRGVKASPYLRVPGRSHNVSAPSCSATLAGGAKKQCSTAWLNANRIVQNGNAAVWISGSRRPDMVVRGMNLDAKKQENSVKYCGPATVQAALRTMKGSAPSQDTLANSDNLQTNRYGFTWPYRLDDALNRYKPSSVGKYALYDIAPVGQSSEIAFRLIHQSISAGQPVVYLVDPSKLPWSSNPTGTSVRHYILLHGYAAQKTTSDTNLNGGQIVHRFSAWDPARGTSHTITVPQLIRASTTSQYIDDNLVFAARK
ncbi:C39 family peptidase [Actinomadura kijaniata]|uniref:C39 family peptidase n=1 Tax=Actinomadura kijaniata TaxID=46161 RepID=UPI003F1BF4B1